jgi:hypothetical protein
MVYKMTNPFVDTKGFVETEAPVSNRRINIDSVYLPEYPDKP